MVFPGLNSVNTESSTSSVTNATVPDVDQLLTWSEQVITWDRNDHPDLIPEPGRYALIVDPIIEGYKFSKVLMDGGSSLDILYIETLEKMKKTEQHLEPSGATFHSIVPGKQDRSLGKITLEVLFGSPENFRSEAVTFEVVPFKSAYHAIFGRPAFKRFMARPCCIYGKLKMPGPEGVITVSYNFNNARECKQGNAAFAEEALKIKA
jgi:hypothetical protein